MEAEEYLLDIVGIVIITDFITLQTNGCLTIHKGYSYDGPSGPTIDTKNFMRGSLVHDVIYQLIREGELPMERRKWADEILRKICREDGMSSFRAWYVYHSVRLFGGSSAKPGKNSDPETITI